MHRNMPIAVCIISNKLDNTFFKVLNRFEDSSLEINVGLNGDVNLDIQSLREKYSQIRWHALEWKGYGRTKNELALCANSPWVFSLDSDEEIDEQLLHFLTHPSVLEPSVVYAFRRGNILNGRKQHFGIWGKAHQRIVRLYHRDTAQWNDAPVHEDLTFPCDTKTQLLPGKIWNHTAKSIQEVRAKNLHYAQLLVRNRGSKKIAWHKKNLSPIFAFIRSYIILLGFLDGKSGFALAVEHARYTWWKYNLK